MVDVNTDGLLAVTEFLDHDHIAIRAFVDRTIGDAATPAEKRSVMNSPMAQLSGFIDFVGVPGV